MGVGRSNLVATGMCIAVSIVTLTHALEIPRYSDAQIRALVGNGAKSIPAVLAKLPDYVKRNLVLVFESLSLQEAHLEFTEMDGNVSSGVLEPRAILWDPRGEFFMSFNGHPTAYGYNSIEMMQFSRSSEGAQFEFSGIEFSDSHEPLNTPGEICVACHSFSYRPIWGEYPVWTGAYGSIEDVVQHDEAPRLAAFREAAEEGGLYQHLFSAGSWTNYPYKKDTSLAAHSESHAFHYRPNARMSVLLNRLNAERVASILKAHPRYPTARAKMAYNFLGCATDAEAIQDLAVFELTVKDLDIRYAYYDERYETMAFSDSYFDGTSTTNELLAAALIKDMEPASAELSSLVKYKSLAEAFSSPHNQSLDSEFIKAADSSGVWISTPFPEWQVSAKKRTRPTADDVSRVRKLCRTLKEMH